MGNYLKRVQKKQEDVGQKDRIKQNESEPLFDQFHAFENGFNSITGTPFRPPMDEHAALLAQARSDGERANQLLHLQRTYGNLYVESLLNSTAIRPEFDFNPSDDIYEPKMGYFSQMAATEPIEEEEMMVEDRGTVTQQTIHYPDGIIADQRLSPVLVPVNPARAGATVIVKGEKFGIWINPAASKCVVEGMKLHEQKHIDDFNADPDYKDIPTEGSSWGGKVPDGETFYYRNDEDAKRFEHPAIDLEMEWLNEQLKDIYELSESDSKIITKRVTKTLPEYRKSFG